LAQKFRVTTDATGHLDFDNSLLRTEPTSVADFTDIWRELKQYKNGVKSITPVNIDDLKQYIDDMWAPGSRGSAFTTPLKNVVRDVLNKNVPKYEEMTKAYAQTANDLRQFRSSLSVGGKAGMETILKKITNAVRGNNSYRQMLLKELGKGSGKGLLSQASGIALADWLPKGLTKYFESLVAFINPHVLMALPLASPRLIGEFVNALGKGNRAMTAIGDGLIKYKAVTALKAGVISNRSQAESARPMPSLPTQ
jgi:hypothetical protein